MSTVSCAEELDFTLMFEGDGGHVPGQSFDVTTSPSSTHVVAGPPSSEELQGPPSYFSTTDINQNVGYQPQGNPRAFGCPSIQITSIAPNNQVEAGGLQEVQAVAGAEGGYFEASWSRDQLYLPLDPCYRDPALCPSPCSSLSSRSWMSDLSSCESFSQVYDDVEGELRAAACLALGSPLVSPLGSPGCGGGAFGVELWQQKYQHPSAYSPAFSPYQSPRQSPCHSPRTSITEDSWLNRRPSSRPSSRPTSPCGKRRHSSADPQARSPSPHHSFSPTPGASPRGSVTDESWVESPGGALGPLLMSGYQELDIPSKTRRTSGGQLGFLIGQADPGFEPFLGSPTEEGQEEDGLAELFLQVPSHFSWSKPSPGNPPLFSASSPPPLDWPLPSQYEQCELKLEVQPKSYHRAHYETEGSRGSIKSATGGHPVIRLNGFSEQPLSLLLFIGTADDRYLRPHCFYQVHRVTGKTVATVCQEKVIGGTKVLEVLLLPENNMSSSIDCAGILKLRNADIELKKGETDIGRKNTRVRVVFRVAVPQPDGRMLWLQTTSVPVECSQRSGQELPQMESFSHSSGSVEGGEELIITGSNISANSRVVFMEKGPDGGVLWEMDAKVLSGKCSRASIVVETPPYSKTTTCPVQVIFYVSNGKRRKSIPQTFTYLPGVGRRPPSVAQVKQEPWELDRVSHNPPGFCPASFQTPSLHPDYDSRDFAVEGIISSQSSPHLHHHPPSYIPLQASPLFPHSSSLPSHISSISSQTLIPLQTSIPRTSILPPQTSVRLPQTSILPPQTSILPPQTSILPPQTSALPPQTSVRLPQPSVLPPQTSVHPPQTSVRLPQTSILPPQTSILPPQTSVLPPQTSVRLPQPSVLPPQTSVRLPQTSILPPQTSVRPPQASVRPPQASVSPPQTSDLPLVTCADPQRGSGEALSVKQEPLEQPNLGSLGLQGITLDDVNEIIDRDIGSRSRRSEPHEPDQYQNWDPRPGEAALPFCGGPR